MANLGEMLLSKKSQIQRDRPCMTLFTRGTKSNQIRKQHSGSFQELKERKWEAAVQWGQFQLRRKRVLETEGGNGHTTV